MIEEEGEEPEQEQDAETVRVRENGTGIKMKTNKFFSSNNYLPRFFKLFLWSIQKKTTEPTQA